VALAVAAAFGSAACAQKDQPGIEVSVDLAEFAGQVQHLRVAISASPGGFQAHGPTSVDNIGVTIEDVDGDGELEMVATFLSPMSPVKFRIATGNQATLTVGGHALAYDATALMAGADTDAASAAQLSPGGRAAIALKLTARSGGVVGPDTRTTDLNSAAPDITVSTSAMTAALAAVAVCDVDGDGTQDIVIGDPAAENLGLPVGAVHVLLGTNGFSSVIDLDNPATGREFRFYGATAGDRLGAAVACAKLNGDRADDLIIGAPGANGGGGRVYAVFGSSGIATRRITPGSTTETADVAWESSQDDGFGTLLFAADLNRDSNAEILAASAGTGKVHLLANVTQAAAAVISVDAADHVSFSNTFATSITAGDLRRAGGADVIIGNSEAKMPNATVKSGAILGFADVMVGGTTQYDGSAPTMVMYGDVNTQFGAAVVALDTTGYGQDLIVGAPGEGSGAGAFYLYKGDQDFFAAPMRSHLPPEAGKVVSGPAANGRFGAALAGTPTGAPGSFSWDLLVGAPGTSRTDARTLGGAAYLFGNGKAWEFPLLEQMFGAATGDQLGAALAGGQVDADSTGDLVAVAPGAGNMQTGVVYVRSDHATQR